MSKLCAAWHKVQSLTQHIHHRELWSGQRDSAASAVEEEQSFVHSYLLWELVHGTQATSVQGAKRAVLYHGALTETALLGLVKG